MDVLCFHKFLCKHFYANGKYFQKKLSGKSNEKTTKNGDSREKLWGKLPKLNGGKRQWEWAKSRHRMALMQALSFLTGLREIWAGPFDPDLLFICLPMEGISMRMNDFRRLCGLGHCRHDFSVACLDGRILIPIARHPSTPRCITKAIETLSQCHRHVNAFCLLVDYAIYWH